MKLQQFDGGLATRLAPQLLQNSQGVVYENIDNATGILSSVKDKTDTGLTLGKYAKYFEAEDKWVSSNTPTCFLEFQNVMYSTDGVTRPKKYSKNKENFLGIERPASKPTLTNTDKAVPLVNITAQTDDTIGNLPAVDLEYLLFNEKGGVLATPFRILIHASATKLTKANGELYSKAEIQGNKLIVKAINGIRTLDNPPNRAVKFSEILGPFGSSAKLYRKYDGVWRLIHTFTTKAGTFNDTVYNVSNKPALATNTITPFNGTYQYVYTYYNKTDGTESAPSEVSKELTVNSGKITVTFPSTSSDPQVTHKRLYRVGQNIALFTMVAELPANTTSYVDTLSDTEVDGRLLKSDNYYEAPTGLKYLTEAYAMLFGAVGSSLRFTPIGKPNAWPPEYELQFNQDITGLGAVSNGILVFTRTSTFIVTGTGPTSLAQQTLRGDQGCISFDSIQEVMIGMLIWASEDGLCSSSGNNVESLTKAQLGKVDLEPVSSAVHDEVYYCHNADGTTLAWDYRFSPILKHLALGVDTLTYARGVLYGTLAGKLYTLFTSKDLLTFKYKSPLFVEGRYTENKTYKKVYVRSEGDIIITILIDKKEVARYPLKGIETHVIQVPQQLQRGYSFQLELEGTGEVSEIEYVASLSKNG